MNIFILDTEPHIAAHYHCDIHVRVMIKESAQLMSIAHRILDGNRKSIYDITHTNHPCTKWVMESNSNYEWLYALFKALHVEYQNRFNKNHRSFVLMNRYLQYAPENIPDKGITQFAQVMPKEFRNIDVVKAYRTYYCFNKLHFCIWSKPASRPWWVNHFIMTGEIQHDI